MNRRWGIQWDTPEKVNHATISVIEQPEDEPVTIRDIQRHARIDFTNEDPSLRLIMVAARQKVEAYLRRALITQTIQLTLDWGVAWVELPRPPIQEIVSVKVTGLDGAEVTANPINYYFEKEARIIGLQPSGMWPTHIVPAGWRCQYKAGYGDAAADVPAAIRLAILNVAAALYDNRGTLDQLVSAQDALIRDYRIEGQPFRFAKNRYQPEFLA